MYAHPLGMRDSGQVLECRACPAAAESQIQKSHAYRIHILQTPFPLQSRAEQNLFWSTARLSLLMMRSIAEHCLEDFLTWLCVACRALACAKPIPGMPQAFFKSAARVIAKNISRPGNIRLRIANISIARRSVSCFCGSARNLLEQCQCLVQGVPVSRSDVKGKSCGGFRFACQQICFDHIPDIREVT